MEIMLLGLEPGYRGQDQRLDKSVLAAVLGILAGGMSFLLAMMLLVFPEWISPLVFANWLRTSTIQLEMATAGRGLEAWTGHVLIPVIDPTAATPTGLPLPSSPRTDPPVVPTSPPDARPSSPPVSPPAGPPAVLLTNTPVSPRASPPTTAPPGPPAAPPGGLGSVHPGK